MLRAPIVALILVLLATPALAGDDRAAERERMVETIEAIARSIGGGIGDAGLDKRVLGALRSNALYDRPDNYWETVADRYRGMTVQVLDETARRYINPGNFVWVVVGDAAVVRPQLERLGLPIEVVAAQ